MALKIQNKIRHYFTARNYKKVLEKLKKQVKKRKIRVLFYVCENSKWASQTLYDLLEKDPSFEPFVVVSLLKRVVRGADKTRINLDENYQFFKSRGMNVEYGFKKGKWIPLRNFAPDIVFYEQQWELPKTHKPYRVSRYALTAYSYYSLPVFDYTGDYSQKFHKMLFRVFADSEENLKRYEKYENGKLENYVVTGYPKLDIYADDNQIDETAIWKEPEKIKIIYAPHHSFADNSIGCATFHQNGQLILELAKKNPQTTWIFKPHPAFRYEVLRRNIMSESEMDEYFREWAKIGRVYTQGDYFDIFKTSDFMISDCCSFLAEYLPTQNPLVRPLGKGNVKLNSLGEKVVEGYYQTRGNEELQSAFYQLVKEGNDPKKDIRLNAIKNVYNGSEKSVVKLINEFKKCLDICYD